MVAINHPDQNMAALLLTDALWKTGISIDGRIADRDLHRLVR